MLSYFAQLLDPSFIIASVGLLGVCLVIFAESGLFFGFFLPGDSLLFTAGFLASQGLLPVSWLLLGCAVGAIAGDSVGYAFGRRMGSRIFQRDDSWLFKKSYVDKTKEFYARYGNKTIVLARFVPIVRTFAPILAGVGEMPYRKFLTYNIVGGLGWVIGLVSAGYILGQVIPGVDQYLLPIVFLIIIISILPGVWHFYQERKRSQS